MEVENSESGEWQTLPTASGKAPRTLRVGPASISSKDRCGAVAAGTRIINVTDHILNTSTRQHASRLPSSSKQIHASISRSEYSLILSSATMPTNTSCCSTNAVGQRCALAHDTQKAQQLTRNQATQRSMASAGSRIRCRRSSRDPFGSTSTQARPSAVGSSWTRSCARRKLGPELMRVCVAARRPWLVG